MPLPLSNIRVLDLTRLLPGPACTRMLAEMGAQVAKIEPPEGDYANRLGLPSDASPEQVAPLYSIVNRGKTIERIDLKTNGGRARLHALVRQSDALIESFRPGVMTRLGLDYDALKAINPSLVYCAITGYGSASAWSHRAGHDINYLAMSGVLDQIGERGRPPAISNWQIADLAGGALAAAASIVFVDSQIGESLRFMQNQVLPFTAFVGSLATTVILYRISSRSGRTSIAIFLALYQGHEPSRVLILEALLTIALARLAILIARYLLAPTLPPSDPCRSTTRRRHAVARLGANHHPAAGGQPNAVQRHERSLGGARPVRLGRRYRQPPLALPRCSECIRFT
ncbi:MAG: CoA transferase, partial [Chamaesiphon sp. CSU_1_12]|nr:CoA transferase [Chamaesiphon sp. CSU_1_12]